MKDEDRVNFLPSAKSLLWGAAAALLLTALLIFIFGAVVYSTNDPNKYTTAASVTIMIVSSLAAGFVGARQNSSLIDGIASGVVFAFVLFIMSLFFDGGTFLGNLPYSVLSRIAEVALAAGGAFIASRGRTRKRIKGAPKMPKIKKI